MIVSQPTQEAMFEIVKQCFQCNRILDRAVSVLGVKFACPQAERLVHHGIAHFFPNLSDSVGELTLERYNISVPYGETTAAYDDYFSVTEIIEKIEQVVVDFQTLFMGACKIALDNDDYHVYANLMELLRDVNTKVEQVILLADKIHFYGEDKAMAFDHDIPDFWILDKE